MQPLPHEIRAALKRRYPHLSDETIDRVDELLVLRGQLDPERHAEQIRALDRERAELIEREMPEYRDLATTREAPEPPDLSSTSEPTVRPADDDTDGRPRLRAPKRHVPRPPAPSPES